MTCSHVLGLIDAGPFADYPRAHLEAAWQHARQCATCAPAVDASAALTAKLTALPQPAPTADLAPGVLARIARIERAKPAAATDAANAAVPSAMRDWSAWVTGSGALTATVAIVLLLASADGGPGDIEGQRAGVMAGPATMPQMTPGAFVLAAGLGLYVTGLFAPLRGKDYV